MNTKKLTREQALQKIRHYCAYQERCHKEVREKLYSLGAWKKDVDEIIATLIEENYLNEERFAKVYAGGKFRIKKWGKTRIRYALKQKDVSDYSISRAMREIPDDEYEITASAIASDRFTELKNEQYLIRKKKTLDHLLYKGYEPDLCRRIVDKLTGGSY